MDVLGYDLVGLVPRRHLCLHDHLTANGYSNVRSRIGIKFLDLVCFLLVFDNRLFSMSFCF